MLHISTSDTVKPGVNSDGNVWAWPAGSARPHYAVVANPPTGSVADNTAIVEVGSAGQISFYDGAAGSPVDLSADVEGYVTSASTTTGGATFAPLDPSRIVDTTNGTGGRSAPLTSDATWSFHVLGTDGIPAAGVSAVALNVGAQATSTNCWLQIQPAGTDAAATGYPRVDTYANYTAQGLAVVAPDSNGDLTLSTNCASTDVHIDVEGYYLSDISGSSGDVYVPITSPTRVVDTRRNVGVTGRLTAGRVVGGSGAIAVRGVAGVPSTADAVALNLGPSNATATGANTIWADGAAQPTTDAIAVNPTVIESNLVFVATGTNGRVDVADTSTDPAESNDLYVDIEGYFLHTSATDTKYGVAQYFPDAWGDTYYNTVGTDGNIVSTVNDSKGLNYSCGTHGSDIAILEATGDEPTSLALSTTNCMTSYGPIAGGGPGRTPDGCSWKSGGITRIGGTIYLAIARQLNACSVGKETNGLQPSFNSSVIEVDGRRKDLDQSVGGRPTPTARHQVGFHDSDGYQAMFPGQTFPPRSSSSTGRATPRRSTGATSICTRSRPTDTPTTATICTSPGYR